MQRKAQRFPTAANIQQRTEIQISAEGWGGGEISDHVTAGRSRKW